MQKVAIKKLQEIRKPLNDVQQNSFVSMQQARALQAIRYSYVHVPAIFKI